MKFRYLIRKKEENLNLIFRVPPYRSLIQELITSLRGSIQQAIDAVSKFSTGLQDMGTQFGEQLVKNVEKYRSRVRASIKSVTDRFTGAGAGVRECIDVST